MRKKIVTLAMGTGTELNRKNLTIDKKNIVNYISPELQEALELAKLGDLRHSQIISELKEKINANLVQGENENVKSRLKLKLLRYLYNMEGNL
ncbi:hypothetical protein [Candidatus Lokiarchaeum ossiferum]|uniref:hypothetical protein n=1 Tax=Candidatus Lokiarchaeum ossiferum TaxID=2951803 RepID=UPI00352F835B